MPLLKHLLLGLCLALQLAAPVVAQGLEGTRVLKGSEVTEVELLDALTPLPPGTVARGILVETNRKKTAPSSRQRPSASLLITFDTNSSALSTNARDQLDVVAGALKNERLQGYAFQVEGHADPRGNADDNLALSQQRADSVRSYLIEAHAIAADRLSAVGKGDLEPLIPSVPAAPENRRVTIVTQVRTP